MDLAHGEADRLPPGRTVAASGPDGAADARPGIDLAGSRPAGADPPGRAAPGAADRAPSAPVTPSYPVTGPGSFGYAAGSGPVLGRSGPLRRYRVAVEERIGQDVAVFAAEVDAILGDGRGWTASDQLRLQRVPRSSPADFTVLLATPASSERMCAAGGLHTERYTSCRLPGKVIINLARWLTAVPEYGAPLAVYHAYAVNHEVGHELGNGHEACPGGGPAPVMQQQTYGLRGCTANGWPYLNGRRHRGPAVP